MLLRVKRLIFEATVVVGFFLFPQVSPARAELVELPASWVYCEFLYDNDYISFQFQVRVGEQTPQSGIVAFTREEPKGSRGEDDLRRLRTSCELSRQRALSDPRPERRLVVLNTSTGVVRPKFPR